MPSMDLQTGEDFALPLDPHRPGACAAMDLHEGYAPIDGSGAFAPLPHDQPLGRLDAPLPTRLLGITACRFFATLSARST